MFDVRTDWALISIENGYFSFKQVKTKGKILIAVLALREVWESETPKKCPGTSKINARKSWTPNF